MLTYRIHRWSLERNQLIEDETSSLLSRVRGSNRNWTRFYLFAGFLILSIFTIYSGWKIYRIFGDGFEFSEELYLFDDGAIIVQPNKENEAHGVLNPIDEVQSKNKYPSSKRAYVSLLCDNSGLDKALVLAYAMKRIKSIHPLVFLTLPFATDGLDDLISLGAFIEKIPMISTPFKRPNNKQPSFSNLCKYSKIHAWSMIQFEKLVFLDSGLLVVHNIDELFQYPEFSAVKAVGDDFNTALFVLEPSLETHRRMLAKYKLSPSNYLGEQGFFNWFFQNNSTKVISARYNTVLRQKDYAVWPLLRRNAKIFHFVPNTTPWNFYYKAHSEWELNFEPIIFYYWHQMQMQSLQAVQRDEFSPSVHWSNVKRVTDICAPQSTSYSLKKFVIQNKFSVLIGTWDRIVLLRKLILHYQKSRLVHKIYVTWHNPSQKPPENFVSSLRKKPPVEILPQKYDSLNNRFNPIPTLETKAVLVCDDDVRVNITDIEYAFDVWRSRPNSLVGVFPRYHMYHPTNNTYTYEIRSPERPRTYSIMLTKFMFMSSEFLYTYTCLLPLRIHRYIDEHMNCEDIAMNLLVSGMTGAKPAAIMVHVDDFGTTSGISGKVGHLNSRSQCMTDLIKLFGRDTLKYNREVFIPFRKKKV